jgi:hypothetical protein
MAGATLSVDATNDSGPMLGDFHVTFNINEGLDGSISWGYGLVVMAYDPTDSVSDGEIAGFYENGELLADVVTSGPDGTVYSWSNGLYQTYFTSDEQRDYLWFTFSNQSSIQHPETLIGTYTTNLLQNGVVIDTATLTTPYTGEDGELALPVLKFPDLMFPTKSETILDTTPTFRWLPFSDVYPGAELEWGLYLDFCPDDDNEYYYWLLHGGIWNPPAENLLVSFPDAPEHPGVTLDKIAPTGKEFPLEIPPSKCWLSLVAREWFFNSGGDPRCYFITAYSTNTIFDVNARTDAKVDVEPDTLNLRSQGKWITAYIELPEGHDVDSIDTSSILLNNTVMIDADAPTAIGDVDRDGTLDMMVKFDRSQVISYILNNVDIEDKSTAVTFSITGRLEDDTVFQGIDTIRVLYTGKGRFLRNPLIFT